MQKIQTKPFDAVPFNTK